MGLIDRLRRDGPKVPKRPRGGVKSVHRFVPPDPVPAGLDPPPSPADVITSFGVAPPRPLVWVGTTSAGADLWSSPVANGAGLQLWREMRAISAQTGLTPVLTGDAAVPSSWDLSEPEPEEVPDGEVLLLTAAGRAVAVEDGLRMRLEPGPEPVVAADAPAGYLALIRLSQAWQLPGAVGFRAGPWSAAEHTGILRSFAERFGAEPVALTEDSLEVLVSRRPRTHEDAYAVARELYAYCPDLVLRGTRTLWGLATTVAVSPSWTFRWVAPG